MSLLDMVNALGEWVLSNFDKALFPASTIIIGYVVYVAIPREITNLGESEEEFNFGIQRWNSLPNLVEKFV